jgi:hypothetical protein
MVRGTALYIEIDMAENDDILTCTVENDAFSVSLTCLHLQEDRAYLNFYLERKSQMVFSTL